MHAHLNGRLHGGMAIDVIDVNHRFVAVGFTFRARHFTSFATDAPLRVHEEFLISSIGCILHYGGKCLRIASYLLGPRRSGYCRVRGVFGSRFLKIRDSG